MLNVLTKSYIYMLALRHENADHWKNPLSEFIFERYRDC